MSSWPCLTSPRCAGAPDSGPSSKTTLPSLDVPRSGGRPVGAGPVDSHGRPGLTVSRDRDPFPGRKGALTPLHTDSAHKRGSWVTEWGAVEASFRLEVLGYGHPVQELSRRSDTSPRAVNLAGLEGFRTIYPDGLATTDPLSQLDFNGMGLL